jgi:regulator of sigma E protease
MSVLYAIAGFIIAISILVVVHEFGHYWVARTLGVKVLRFSVGFGRPLWMRRFGKDRTEWVIAALPFGGYVKMLDEHEGEVAARDRPRAFNRQALWKRTLIVLAGPMFNLAFAVLVYSGVNLVGMDGLRPVVGRVVEGGLGERAGFAAGDALKSIDGRLVQSWDQHRMYLYERALDQSVVRYVVTDSRGREQERLLDFTGMSAREVGAGSVERAMGLAPQLPDLAPELETVEAGGPAARAGIRSGDVITAVDGKPVRHWPEVVTTISSRPGEELQLDVRRGDITHRFQLTIERAERQGQSYGRIGVGVRIPELTESYRVRVQFGPLEAVQQGAETTWRMSLLTLKMLWKLLMLEVSTQTISGPLTIAQYAGATVQIGFERFVMFLAVVSISLGVLNLLPIPVLDGGHLLFYTYESLRGKPLSDAALHRAQQMGIAMLMALMALALYNDFVRLLF